MSVRKLVDLGVYLVVRMLVCVVQALRIETGQRLTDGLAWLLGDVLRVRARVVEENLRHAFPELAEADHRRLARAMWRHLFLLVLEVAHAPRKIHQTNWRDFVELRNADRLLRLLFENRPILITTAHFGNFEVAGYVLGLLGFPSHTVARNLDNPYLDRYVNRFRGATGQYIIPKNGGYDEILAVLNAGGTMTLLADQYAGPKGCWVEFFGRPASAHKAIGLLAIEHGAPVVISYARRLGRPLRFQLGTDAVADPLKPGPEFDSVRALTQWYTDWLETLIRTAPGQYWWIHRRWKDTRPPKAARRVAAA